MTIKRIIFASILLFGSANLIKASEISCSPAPCATANVQVTPSSSTADAVEFAVGSTNNNGGSPAYTAVSVGSNYYVSGLPCNSSPVSKAATWSSPDPGATSFSGGCVVPPTNWVWATDPVAASYVPSATGSSQKIFVGHIVGSPNEAHEGWDEVMIKNSTNGGSTWSAYSETAEPIAFDSGDPNASYNFDNDGLFIDGSSGIYNGCGYIGIQNQNYDDAKLEIEGAVGCPAETAANWNTVKIWSMPSTDYAADFARLTSDQDDATYVFATWAVCPSKKASGECASTAGGDTVHIYFSSSTNNGSTWSTPTNIFDVKLSPHIANTFLSPGWGSIPNTGERTAPIPQLSAYGSGVGEKLVIVYQTWNGTSLEVNYRTSTDKGVTWSSESHVNSQTHDQFMPCMAIGNQGSTSIGPYVAWLDRRNDTNNKKYDAYAAFWNGTSFTHVTRLSTNSSDSSKNHLGGGTFIGDYIGCNVWNNSSNTNEYFLVTWPDTSLTTGMVGMLAGYLGN